LLICLYETFKGVAKDSMKNEKHKLQCDNGQMILLTKLKLEAHDTKLNNNRMVHNSDIIKTRKIHNSSQLTRTSIV
jgi:hypothetical protein